MTEQSPHLEQSICFQMYVASKEIIRLYKPYLNEYNLTYTGFIAMLAIEDGMSVSSLGEALFLDSGTLSPLLKKLEKHDLIKRVRSKEDERVLVLKLTEQGQLLKEKLPKISETIYKQINEQAPTINYPQLLETLRTINRTL
ncbi:MarR family transcriptional regulator [Vagococcus coleopterorum]|uniref:MarR family transcriptional regulator n=1 Tax=Vagococcus coleopterorum TaxID=2714946 RepID=A0A6G8AM95_9ENTE|nr:MarR family transcriptional regulator [Vagococcus coleopterorum]QIL46204.1 MarR family transcriptional regulator [Vagococcus coleopterorum]